MAANQDALNALVADQQAAVARLGDSLTGIAGDVDTILQQLSEAQANSRPLDFGPLADVRDRLNTLADQGANLDAENPAPVPSPPVDGQS